MDNLFDRKSQPSQMGQMPGTMTGQMGQMPSPVPGTMNGMGQMPEGVPGGMNGIGQMPSTMPGNMNGMGPMSDTMPGNMNGAATNPMPGNMNPTVQTPNLMTGSMNEMAPMNNSTMGEMGHGNSLSTQMGQMSQMGPMNQMGEMPLPQPSTEVGKIYMYDVRRGDTVYAIARRFNTSVDFIKNLNELGAKDTIHPGQKLLIPVLNKKPQPRPTTQNRKSYDLYF